MNIAVTGGSGRAGAYIIADLLEHGHEVVNVDVNPPDDGPGTRFIHADVTDYGEVVSALRGAEAVIHMAAIPNPLVAPEHKVFAVNMVSNWNVLEAAEVHGTGKIVIASSVNAIGAVFSKEVVPPSYFPIDEAHPTRTEDSYSQSKWLGEQMAKAFCRRRPVQIASMRFHGLWDQQAQRRHRESGPRHDPVGRSAMHFWGWLDRRDAARACRLAIEADWTGHHAFFLNGRETTLEIPTMEALEKAYPGVPVRKPLPGFTTPIDIEKAERLLRWTPRHSWRDA